MSLKLFYPREENLVKYWMNNLNGDLFIDIGAGEGQYSINLSNNFNEIWAIEPFSRHFRLLNKNIEKYGISNIKTFKVAIGDRIGSLKLYGNREILLSHGSPSAKQTYTASVIGKTFRFKDILEEVKELTLERLIGKRMVDLVKVDVEGYESNVLKGAKEVMNQINAWQIEVHDWLEKEEIVNSLYSYNYKVEEKSASYIYNPIKSGGWLIARRI